MQNNTPRQMGSSSPSKRFEHRHPGFFDKNKISNNRVRRERLDKVLETKFSNDQIALERQCETHVAKGGPAAASLGIKQGSSVVDQQSLIGHRHGKMLDRLKTLKSTAELETKVIMQQTRVLQ